MPTTPEQALAQLTRLQETLDLLDRWVDPNERFAGTHGELWQPVGYGGQGGKDFSGFVYQDEGQLAHVRDLCRWLATNNEYVIGVINNRIGYVVGCGHLYEAVAKKDRTPSDALLVGVQAAIDEFIEENDWDERQEEIVRRNDRDGETFLRFFSEDGLVRVRFVEPGSVYRPTKVQDANATFGIVTEPDDVETVLGYWIDDEFVPADVIQHRKMNVDRTNKRGVSTFFPCKTNLKRADNVIRNAAATTEIQAAIAMIRIWANQSAESVQNMITARADVNYRDPLTQKTQNVNLLKPGSIVDSNAAQVILPSAGLDPSKPVALVQGVLRAVGAALVMPEYMVSGDASNANYSSTLVAESPAVRNFERLQHRMIKRDREVFMRVIDAKVASGDLPPNILDEVEIKVTPPKLEVREKLPDIQGDKMLASEPGRVMSRKTLAAKHGLDYEVEKELIAEEDEEMGLGPGGQLPPMVDPNDDEGDDERPGSRAA